MDEIKRIYSLLLHSNGLKVRDISKVLELDKYDVAEILFSPQNISYWYQDDDSLWFAKEGALQIEELEEEIDELIAPVEIPQRFNVNKFLEENLSDSLRSYLGQISKYRIYSNDEMIELFKRYRNGDQKAFDRIIKSQQRLVVNIAFFYTRKGAFLEDVIQEGNIGLVKAAQRFDYIRYRSFANYAKSWILQSISFSMGYLPYAIRLPFNQLAMYRKVRIFKEKYEQQNCYPPSLNDIIIDDDIDFDKLKFLDSFPDNLKDLTCLCGDMDVFEGESNIAERQIQREFDNKRVLMLLYKLDKRNRDILQMSFGINMPEETLSSIGEKYYLTRERVRQIKEKSIRKLRDISGIKKEECKIGDYVCLISSSHIGKIINIKKSPKGYRIYVLKMGKGYTEEVEEHDIDYKVRKKQNFFIENTKNSYDKKIIQEHQYNEDNLNVGDIIYYNKLICKVKRVIGNDKLIIEYNDGDIDFVPYNKSVIEKIPQYRKSFNVGEKSEILTENDNSLKKVQVGDRLLYNSKPCVVIEKRCKYNIDRLLIKYDDGRTAIIDNLEKYKIL